MFTRDTTSREMVLGAIMKAIIGFGGRVDDVVNVSGHRLSTAEIEAALIEHNGVAEAAVVGINDEMTGQAVNAFVSLKDGVDGGDQTKKDLILQVRKSIGPFAAPKVSLVLCYLGENDLQTNRLSLLSMTYQRQDLARSCDEFCGRS